MSEQQPEEQQKPADEVSKIDCSRPGELLKNARVAKGLTQEEVAKKLNFLPIYIPALENEQFEPLHSVTFIKGYLRAYARFLGIDAEQVLYCFAQHHPELVKQETHAPVEVMRPEKQPGGLLFKLVTFLVIVALLAIIIMWWQSRTAESLPSVSNQEVKVDTLDGNTIIAPIQPKQVEIEAPEEATEKELEIVEEQPVQPVVQEKPAAKKVQQPVVALEPTKPATDIAGDPAAATLGNDKLVALSFNDECWVEVREDTGALLHASLMQAGDKILLEGKPPFRMVFGYGKAVDVFYRGQAFDFSSRIRPNGYASIQVK